MLQAAQTAQQAAQPLPPPSPVVPKAVAPPVVESAVAPWEPEPPQLVAESAVAPWEPLGMTHAEAAVAFPQELTSPAPSQRPPMFPAPLDWALVASRRAPGISYYRSTLAPHLASMVYPSTQLQLEARNYVPQISPAAPAAAPVAAPVQVHVHVSTGSNRERSPRRRAWSNRSWSEGKWQESTAAEW